MVKSIKKSYAKDGNLTKDEKSIAYATAWKNYNKEDWKPEIEHSKLGDAKKKKDKERESKLPPHLQGDALGKMKKAFATEEDKKGKGSGKKDACYHKVKASAKVWPSAYASGRLVQCRKKGAANYGNKSEEVQVEGAAWTKKSGKNKSGGLNQKGRKSYEAENQGSDLKAPSKKVGNPRRKSFCARMKGMKKKLTSAKTARDPDSRINKSLRAWNCGYEPDGTPIMEGINFTAFRKKAADVKKKPEKAMDAGAKARRSLQRRDYAKTVSGSTDRVPKELED